MFLSAQLLAARLGVASIDANDVRRKFVSASEPEATRLQALEALVAFRNESLLDSLPQVLSSPSPQFVTRVFPALGRFDHVRLADVLLAEEPNLAPDAQ